jgi:hypothetical protein
VRVECEACRELIVASFAIDGGAVRATCPLCRHVMNVPAAPATPIEAAIEAAIEAPAADAADAAPSCPKCGALRRDEAPACPSCGLPVARMAAYTEARDAAVPGAVREAWTRVTAAWHDAARHDELLHLVATTRSYAWAAGRYRTRGRDPVAQRQLDRLRRAAEATLLAGAAARPEATVKPYRATRRVLALLITTIAAGALYAMVLRDLPSPSSIRPIPARLLPPAHPAGPPPGK